MQFTKEQIEFIMQCVENTCELFNSEYKAIEKELEKFEKKLDKQPTVVYNKLIK